MYITRLPRETQLELNLFSLSIVITKKTYSTLVTTIIPRNNHDTSQSREPMKFYYSVRDNNLS